MRAHENQTLFYGSSTAQFLGVAFGHGPGQWGLSVPNTMLPQTVLPTLQQFTRQRKHLSLSCLTLEARLGVPLMNLACIRVGAEMLGIKK